MELQFENQACRYLRRLIWEVKEQEQTQEVRLPDGMPDIGNILAAWGQCVMRSKEWNGDHIGTSGGVNAKVLYAPADGSPPQSVEVWLPIQLRWNLPDNGKNGSIRCSWLLKGVDGRTLSARKMMVRANVSVLAEALEPSEEMLARADQVPEDVQMLRNIYPARLPVEAGEKAFLIDEEFTLPEGQPKKIICCTVIPQLSEQKVLGGKVVFRGCGNLHMLYEDQDGRLHSCDRQLEFSQYADLDRDYDKDAQAQTVMALSSLEPELQEGTVRVKCGMVAQYLIADLAMLDLVEDAYSPQRQVTLESREVRLPMVLDSCREKLRCGCTVPEKAERVVDVSVFMEQPVVRRAGELAEVSCSGLVQVLYFDENGDLQGRSGRWNGAWELPTSAETELLADIHSVDTPQVSAGTSQMELSLEVQMAADAVASHPMSMVTGLEMGQVKQSDPARPSLILRRAGDSTLWEMAKGTGSTVDAIRKANGLTGEPLDDRLLLIPVS